ncbi:MAG: hypothetical protein JW941_03005 [Candidatus Coatesbacteria bacterium]|nr:hypothetical protein [Candidatus Coatesbacteria bacterium]
MRVGKHIILIMGILLTCALARADEIIVELTAGEYTVEDLEDGEVIHIEDASIAASPGSPMLPHKVYNVALPPDVVLDSIRLSIVEITESALSGVFDIAPTPPVGKLDGSSGFEWGDATNIVDGKDMDIYGRDAFVPSAYVEIAKTCQMRKWKFAQIAFFPFRFNPVQRQLRLCDAVTIKIEFSRDANLLDENSLRDSVMDRKAAQMLVNYSSASDWYTPNAVNSVPADDEDTFNYVIITTEAILQGSSKVSDLKTHLQDNLGFRVLIVTESHSYEDGDAAGGYNAKTGQAPNGTDDKIRKWLQDNYLEPPNGYGIVYVLLIGDPRTSGDLPMKTCYPGTGYSVPTDYYFADLTGDWDSDGDATYGENGQDEPDFYAEVFPARIPVYNAAYSTLDGIIQKEIDYDTASGDLGWRKQVLFPLSFPWATQDPSHIAQCMKSEYLDSRGFSYYETYQDKATGCTSDYPYDELLVGSPSTSSSGGTAYNRWKDHPYGMVWWYGHGNASLTAVGYGSSCSDGYMFYSGWCPNLDDSHPAFTFQISCSNGLPSSTINLGYSLLKNGAVSTCSASAVAWGWDTDYDGEGTCQRRYGCSEDLAFYYGQGISNYDASDGSCLNARALCDAKAYLSSGSSSYASDSYSYHSYFAFNLYGCPHTRLVGEANTYIRLENFEANASGSNIVLTWETGAEIDNAGFIIYRSDGTERKAISRLIGAEGSASAGASYRFVDDDVEAGVTYQYWLVDIDTSGTWTAHGPVSARINLEATEPQRDRTVRDHTGNQVRLAR